MSLRGSQKISFQTSTKFNVHQISMLFLSFFIFIMPFC